MASHGARSILQFTGRPEESNSSLTARHEEQMPLLSRHAKPMTNFVALGRTSTLPTPRYSSGRWKAIHVRTNLLAAQYSI